MLGEDGQKMSKSKRNYREPSEIFDRYGADALRWYFFANQPPWTTIRYSEQAIKDSIPEFLLRLWNVYSFFVIYANIDGFDPRRKEVGVSGCQGSGIWMRRRLQSAKSYRPMNERSELDRWILSELNRTCRGGRRADGRLRQLRRLPARSPSSSTRCRTGTSAAAATGSGRPTSASPEKLDAYWTLYECLLTTAKLIAPFVPFLAESDVAESGRRDAERERGAAVPRKRPPVRLSRPATRRPSTKRSPSG